MKPDKLNPKAREAFGKSLIDVGTSIFKSIILLVTALPITLIIKSTFDNNQSESSIFKLVGNMPMSTYFTFITLIVIAVVIGIMIRNEGLRHLNEIENNDD